MGLVHRIAPPCLTLLASSGYPTRTTLHVPTVCNLRRTGLPAGQGPEEAVAVAVGVGAMVAGEDVADPDSEAVFELVDEEPVL